MGDFEKLGFEVTAEGNALNTFENIYKTLQNIQKLGTINVNVNSSTATKERTQAETSYAEELQKTAQLSDMLLAKEKELAKAREEFTKNFKFFSQNGFLSDTDKANAKIGAETSAYKLAKKNELRTEQQGNTHYQEQKSAELLNDSINRLSNEKAKLNSLQIQSNNVNAKVANAKRKNAEQTKYLKSEEYKEIRTKQILNNETKKAIDNQIKQEQGLEDNSKALSKYLAKFTSIIVVVKKLAHFTSQAIKETADYTENLNLFAVAYGQTYKQQLEWATGIAEAYGLANNEVIKFAGTFRELSSSLGLVGDTADIVTKAVTNLGYDFSALFNTSVEDAMEKLQSGIFSGNVRPLRSFGIDISQGQIDELFETNEALSKLGISARNLSQSEKTIARLIITLQSGKDSFGTMAREINNLQSQFRILQGSLSNFKLAIGDLVNKPLSDVMVVVNAFIIAITNAIRSFVPLKKDDDTPKAFLDIADNAESATEEIEKLSGSLAGFDKFNVLQKNEGEGTNSLATEELTKLLQEQVSLYDSELTAAMEKMQNEAVELAEKLQDILVVGGIFFAVFSASKFLGVVKSLKTAKDGISVLGKSFLKLNDSVSLTNGLFLTGLIFTIYKAVEAFKEGDKVTGWFAVAMGVSLVGAMVAFNWQAVKTIGINLYGWLHKVADSLVKLAWRWADSTKQLQNQAVTAKQVAGAIGAMVAAYSIADSVINMFGEEGRKTASICFIVAGGIMAIVAAVLALNGVMTWGTALPILLASVGAAVAGVKGLTTEIKGFAEGGFTNANLIMTNENGVKEWVGQQGQSTAVVNDTQMNDIMRQAVSQGVYNALTAYAQQNGQKQTEQPIKVIIGDQEVFTVVRKVAKRQGLDFAKA